MTNCVIFFALKCQFPAWDRFGFQPRNLCRALQIESLAHLGLTKADFPAALARSQKSSSMQGNPIRLAEAKLLEILRMALEHNSENGRMSAKIAAGATFNEIPCRWEIAGFFT
jgi:hypothetical protein